jgi:hypothetical protein
LTPPRTKREWPKERLSLAEIPIIATYYQKASPKKQDIQNEKVYNRTAKEWRHCIKMIYSFKARFITLSLIE